MHVQKSSSNVSQFNRQSGNKQTDEQTDTVQPTALPFPLTRSVTLVTVGTDHNLLEMQVELTELCLID